MLWCQMRIADGHLNRLVPHQLLNCPKVYSRHDQPTCESVAEAMPGEVLQPRSLHGGTKPEPRRAQTGSVTGEEHIRAAVLVGLNRSQRDDPASFKPRMLIVTSSRRSSGRRRTLLKACNWRNIAIHSSTRSSWCNRVLTTAINLP